LSAPEAVYAGPPTLSIGLRLLREADAVLASPALVVDAAPRLTELVCAACGYGAACRSVPDHCPMCHESQWEYAAWRPFSSRLDA
jgi:hypothetical protein